MEMLVRRSAVECWSECYQHSLPALHLPEDAMDVVAMVNFRFLPEEVNAQLRHQVL
jgi:hypothetical protein